MKTDPWLGCVVAGRLANLDPNLQILIIEAGEDNLENPWYVVTPSIYSASPLKCH